MKNRQNIRKFLLLISFILYPVTFFVMSPDLLMFGASERIMAGDIMFFGLLFILSFFVGRLFCGWVCPAGALQDFCFDINKKPANNKLNWIKWLQFIPWITFFVFLVIYFGGINQVDFFYKRAFGVSMVGMGEWVMYFGTVAIVCPMSLPVAELIKSGEIGHSECTLCSTCVDTCPEGVIKFAFRNH